MNEDEDVADGSSLGRSGLRVKGGSIEASGSTSRGVLLRNADGVKIVSLDPVSAAVGIELDATSDNNVMQGNDLTAATTKAIDDGTGNCWQHNTPNVSGCP